MKNRDYKQFAEGAIHHMYNRGVGKMDIFRDTQDLLNFYKRLNAALGNTRMTLDKQGSSLLRIQPLPQGAFSILCYALMPNHYHFIIRQNTEVPVSKLIAKVSTSYSMYFNAKYNHAGGVFQDQFKAVRIESDEQLLWTSAYIHNNPKTAGLAVNLIDYPWSSYSDYAGLRNGSLCDKSLVLKMFNNNINAYGKFVEDSFEKIKERKDLERLLLD